MPRWLTLIGRVIGVLLLLIVVGVLTAYFITERRVHRKYAVDPVPVTVVRDSATIARGKHLAIAIAKCGDCHGENLAGLQIFNDKVFGRMWGANLTGGKGSQIAQYTDAEIARVIRRGVRRDSTSVIFMPSVDYTHFNDADVAAIIAYIRSLTPVDQTPPPHSLGPIARMLVLRGDVPIVLPASHLASEAKRVNVPAGATAEYGDYLATVGGCKGCHGQKLEGGPIPGVPPDWPAAANLTPAGIGSWTEADFTRALRQGIRPDGRILSATMPWKYTALMTDDEIRAVWLYLKTLPAGTPAGTPKAGAPKS